MGVGFNSSFSSSLLISGRFFHLSPHKMDTAPFGGFHDALQLPHVAPVAQNHFMPERSQHYLKVSYIAITYSKQSTLQQGLSLLLYFLTSATISPMVADITMPEKMLLCWPKNPTQM